MIYICVGLYVYVSFGNVHLNDATEIAEFFALVWGVRPLTIPLSVNYVLRLWSHA